MQHVRAARFWLLAFAGSYVVWLIHDDTIKPPELLAGVAVAALAATGTELVRRQRTAEVRFRARFLRKGWRVIPASVRDSVALTRLVFQQLVDQRPVRGQTVAMPFAPIGDDFEANARRALAAGLGSFAPGTVVIGVDPESELVIVHQLGSRPEPSNLDPLELG